jgi:nucleoside-diphosphate-sugar epimerase
MYMIDAIAITGSTGYIGSSLTRAALSRGLRVFALSRRIDPTWDSERVQHIPFQLGVAPSDMPFNERTAFVHLAHSDTLEVSSTGDVNVRATRELRDRARAAGCPRFVFISSQSAQSHATRSGYAESKAAGEALMETPAEVSVRPGLVYGGELVALYGRLCKLVQGFPVLPIPRPDAPIQPIHVDDLAEGICRIAVGPTRSERLYALGAPAPMSFAMFLRTLARDRFSCTVHPVGIPLRPLLPLLAYVATLNGSLGDISERLAGLYALAPMDTRSSLDAIDLRLRDLSTSLRAEAALEQPRP